MENEQRKDDSMENLTRDKQENDATKTFNQLPVFQKVKSKIIDCYVHMVVERTMSLVFFQLQLGNKH